MSFLEVLRGSQEVCNDTFEERHVYSDIDKVLELNRAPLYTRGFLGEPQSFHFNTGEYGPPINSPGEIDWEIFCFLLTGADIILSLAFVHLIQTTPPGFRLKGVSPTLKFTIGSIYGSWRCSLILYMFRSKPAAVYQYVAVFSWLLYSYFGMIALIFERGPWKNLRGSRMGVYVWETEFNPMFLLGQRIKKSLRSIEYKALHEVQRLTKFKNNKGKSSKRSKNLGFSLFAKLKIKVSEIVSFSSGTFMSGNDSDSSTEESSKEIERRDSDELTLEGPGQVMIRTSLLKWNEAMLYCSLAELENHFCRNRVAGCRDLHPRLPKSSSQPQSYIDVQKFAFDKEKRQVVSNEEIQKQNDKLEFSVNALMTFQNLEEREPSIKHTPTKRRSRSGSGSSDGSKKSRTGWTIQKFQSEINSVGFSYGSSWLNDFVETIDEEDLMGELENSKKSLNRSLVRIGANGLIYEFDTNQPRPDIKTVLNLEHSFEKMRRKLKTGKFDRNNKLSTEDAKLQVGSDDFVFIELIGKIARCRSGEKMFYFFADYSRYNIKLNQTQKDTVLWLMNKLNGTNQKRLVSFRIKNSFASHPVPLKEF